MNFKNLTPKIKENYYSHPHYPGLFAMIETLSSLNIASNVKKVAAERFDTLPENFIADIKIEDTFKFVFATKTLTTVEFTYEDGNTEEIPHEDFKLLWSGLWIEVNSKQERSFRGFLQSMLSF